MIDLLFSIFLLLFQALSKKERELSLLALDSQGLRVSLSDLTQAKVALAAHAAGLERQLDALLRDKALLEAKLVGEDQDPSKRSSSSSGGGAVASLATGMSGMMASMASGAVFAARTVTTVASGGVDPALELRLNDLDQKNVSAQQKRGIRW